MKKIYALTPETEAEKKARKKEQEKRAKEKERDAQLAVPKELPKPAVKIRTIANLKLWGDRVLIQQEEAKKDINGIIIPDTAKHKPARGKIVGKGPKCTEAVVGETVYFGKYAGTPIPLNEGEELLILREADVFMSDGN